MRAFLFMAIMAAVGAVAGVTVARQAPEIPDPQVKFATGLRFPALEVLRRIRAEAAKRNGATADAITKVAQAAAPAEYDARTKGYVGPIKNQGNCGSCWDFSAVLACECAFAAAGHPNVVLSEQYSLDCCDNGGCDGDWPGTVLEHAKLHGLPKSADYGAYTARPGPCRSAGLAFAKINDYGFCDPRGANVVPSPDAIKAAILAYGSASVCVAADNAFSNWRPSQGVFRGSGATSINHAVAVVGWKTDPNLPSGGYWILRNSWGTSWGDQGYMQIAYGANRVGYSAMFAVVEKSEPLPPGEKGFTITDADLLPASLERIRASYPGATLRLEFKQP
jgi:hypothetical protein